MTHTQAQINLIVPISTQVVTQIKTQSPKGSVRPIIQIPTDGNHTYRIQLPTGTIVPLKRHEFSIRKQFQSEGLITPLSDRNLKDHVIYRVIIGR